MTPLHRHQIAWLSPDGWQRVCGRAWDPAASACLAHWAERGLPLVVTRQRGDRRGCNAAIDMGLPAPGVWERRRIALRIPRADISHFGEFPGVGEVIRLVPDAARIEWRRLCDRLRACGVVARVYGSYGWQQISGLDHLRNGSDIDVWVAVSNDLQADAAAAALLAFRCSELRLDGELIFEGGSAVAWREWMAWRAGHARALLVKSLDGAALSRRLACRSPQAQDVQ